MSNSQSWTSYMSGGNALFKTAGEVEKWKGETYRILNELNPLKVPGGIQAMRL